MVDNLQETRKDTLIKEAKEWARSIVLAIIIAIFIRLFLFEVFLVEGSSMYPTLQNHERLIVNKATYFFNEPEKGDIIVFRFSPQRDFIKRVIAVEGDVVEISNNRLFVDGFPLDEPYLENYHMMDFGPVTIPEGHIFVLGDNRGNSMDSRDPAVGYVSRERVKGKAVVIFWPPFQSRILNCK
ncbi:MAG TPA: signal peptidase I [Firmicutes bacterium]|jgi:signal peptidase I|nr:signal peptidase I [Bacillota bacterium]